MDGFNSNKTPKMSVREREDECVGFSILPDRIHRKTIKKGFDFTVMAVGETGLGKSTLLSCLFFKEDLYSDRTPEDRDVCKTVKIEKRYLEIEERGVKLRLNIIDTPGFADSLDASDDWHAVDSYIEKQHENYLKEESGMNRKLITDCRIHCCLYFIPPHGRGLRPIDIKLMRQIHEKVNVVPIIAKADTMTSNELRAFKAKILNELQQNDIHFFYPPQTDPDDDEDFKRQSQYIKESYPFAVVGGDSIVEMNGRKFKGRIYPWGIVEIENSKHSDLKVLRQFLTSSHMYDLVETTRETHYEVYRSRQIKRQSSSEDKEEILRAKEQQIYEVKKKMAAVKRIMSQNI